MKKRIFISVHYMEIGGAEMSLIGLLNAIDYDNYDVDLFICSHQGELMQFIPNKVNVLPEILEYANLENPIIEVIKRGAWTIALARLIAKLKYNIRWRRNLNEPSDDIYGIIADYVSPFLPSLDRCGCYDLAISYIGIPQIVLQKVDAAKKIVWLHTDYTTVKSNIERSLSVMSAFDHIISISAGVTKAFLARYPSLKERIVEVENVLSAEFVRQRSEQIDQCEVEKEMPIEEGVIRLLSIGRFCEAKNYDNVPDICRRVNSLLIIQHPSLKIKWYIIGWGSDEG